MVENSLTFYNGACCDTRSFFTIGYFDDLEAPDEAFPRMRLVRFDRIDNQWEILSTQDFNAIGAAAWRDSVGHLKVAVAGKSGDVLIQDDTGFELESVDPVKTLALNDLVVTETGLSVVGGGSAAYTKQNGGAWRKIFEGLTFEELNRRTETIGNAGSYSSIEEYAAALKSAMDGYETFYCVAGEDLSSLLIGSDRGRLFYWDGSKMEALQADTGSNLTQITKVDDGWILAGFAPTSVVIHVALDTRSVTTLFEDSVKRMFTSVARYGDKVLVAGLAPLHGGVFEVTKSGLVPFGPFLGDTWAIKAVDGGLWVLGGKEISFMNSAGVQSFASPYL